MKNEMLPTDYLNATLGSYNPSALAIKINKTQSTAMTTDAGIDSFNPRDCTTLFHEFCHKLQNTSSVIGYQFFNLITSIWHNGRSYNYDSKDEESKTSNTNAVTILNTYPLNKNKKIQKRNLLEIRKIHNIEVIEGQNYNSDPVAVSYIHNDSEFEFMFGIGEFYESCADVLERLFCEKINYSDDFSIADSIPYKTGESIVKFFNPQCSDYRLLILLLTSMQHSYPHQMFVMLSSLFNNPEIPDQIVREVCEEHARIFINSNKEWITLSKETLDNGFPYEDPFLGDVFKLINSSIEKNLSMRAENPFFELDFLDRITENNYKDELVHFIECFGGCIIYVDDQSRELSIGYQKIVIGENSVFNQEKEFMTFQCSVFLAAKNINGYSVSNVEKEYACPAFNYCENMNKTKNKNHCLTAPHNHPKVDATSNNCPFQLAAYKYDLKNHDESN